MAELLAVCWENGVPVIYLPDVPVIGAKMDALLTRCGERPVILVTKKWLPRFWPETLLFSGKRIGSIRGM